ncbi:hypothetical protein ABK905_21395 [Acerihabitans sp. KWT182]|uniref:Uncharacterized protein n=1 Tax=Acerihabitans sp. KWT182 TaxID=3157919 RepID=A0AAU7Q7K2_9GAMM
MPDPDSPGQVSSATDGIAGAPSLSVPPPLPSKTGLSQSLPELHFIAGTIPPPPPLPPKTGLSQSLPQLHFIAGTIPPPPPLPSKTGLSQSLPQLHFIAGTIPPPPPLPSKIGLSQSLPELNKTGRWNQVTGITREEAEAGFKQHRAEKPAAKMESAGDVKLKNLLADLQSVLNKRFN